MMLAWKVLCAAWAIVLLYVAVGVWLSWRRDAR